MKLLDLYCGAGGAGMGYHLAGFDVTGVDIKYQRHYPFEFHQGDAIEFLKENYSNFDAIHASPPCQAFTIASAQWKDREYSNLIEATRRVLIETKLPYIIENVVGAPLINPITLNGTFFGIKVRRVRLFETNFEIPHIEMPKEEKAYFRTGKKIVEGDIITPVGHFSNVEYAKKEMGINWMTRDELAQAIPPIYTRYIGKLLMDYLLTK